MQLSLVICTYNRSKDIKVLLQSLKNQTVIPDEILIIDASENSETELVVSFEQNTWVKGKIIYYRVSVECRGLTRQRNYGIAHSSGQIISFLDDDTVPNIDYFEEILSCFDRHPEAVGIGGYIYNEVDWKLKENPSKITYQMFSHKEWERKEDLRWQLRKLLKLDSPSPPGWIPESGHGRSLGFIPPDGGDYLVQCLMGGASSWKKELFSRLNFSHYFEGYGLYEDLDFSIRALKEGRLYLCTRAQLAHYHAPSGRPNHFEYGKMVVRNGWFVWRRQWENPSFQNSFKWWSITYLLAILRLVDIRNSSNWKKSLLEGTGRIWGAFTILWNKPKEID